MLLLLLIVAWWSALVFAVCGWGFLVLRACGKRSVPGVRLPEMFWLGLALVLAFLQTWHLFLRAGPKALAVIGAVGLLGWIRFAPRGASLWLDARNWLLGFLALLLGGWIAMHAVAPVTTYDTGLYHLPAVNWARGFPAVPGLGNLHSRLASNQSFFLFAAALDEWPWWHQAVHLVNGLVFWAFLLTILSAWAAVFRHLRHGVRPPLADRFLALMLGPAIVAGFGVAAEHANFLSGLAPEPALFALGTLLTAQILRLLTVPRAGDASRRRFHFVSAALLAAAGLSIKLSFAGFAGGAGLVALGWLAWRRHGCREEWRPLAGWAAGAAALVLVPWLIRGIILSGYPAYPSTLGGLPVDWRVPAVMADSEANWVRYWARQPNAFWLQSVGNWNWLPAWIERVPPAVTLPLRMAGLGALAFAALLMTGFCALGARARPAAIALVLPLLALTFWWLAAPDPRFVGAAFWVLAVGIFNLVLAAGEGANATVAPAWSRSASVGLMLALPWLCLPAGASLLPKFPNEAKWAFTPVPQVKERVAATDSGLELHLPADRDKGVDTCWDMPLPNTPYFRSDLELRRPPSLRGGFRARSPDLYVDYDHPSAPVFKTDAGLSVRLVWNWEIVDAAAGRATLVSPARFLVHADRPGAVQLTFRPRFEAPPTEGHAAPQWTLRNFELGAQAHATPAADGAVSLAVDLRRGFNQLELSVPSEAPARAALEEIALRRP